MYNVRMLVAFAGTAFVPYWLNYQLATIPLTLGVVAAGISDIDDRFSVRIMNLIYTYIGFFITAVSVQFLFPYPIAFAIGLITSCIGWILLGSLGRRYATIAYGCLVVSVYSMLGVHLFEQWYMQPALLVAGAAWYGLISTISFLLFPVRQLQDQLAASYRALGSFLFAKANVFDVDMTASSYQQSMIDVALENSKLITLFNHLRIALLTRLKGDRGKKIHGAVCIIILSRKTSMSVPTLRISTIKNWQNCSNTAIFYFVSNACSPCKAKPVRTWHNLF